MPRNTLEFSSSADPYRRATRELAHTDFCIEAALAQNQAQDQATAD